MTNDLRTIADGVIAAGLPLGGKPGRRWMRHTKTCGLRSKRPTLRRASRAVRISTSIIDKGLTPTVPTDYARWRPLHWVVEAPDVLVDHGGFDAMIGNPPFLGGLKLTGAFGVPVRDWIVNQLAWGAKGAADLVAYFFLRASLLVRESGLLGLIATNTLAQGDTREVGLDQLVSRGVQIYRAIQSRPWPSASAGVSYAAAWLSLAPLGGDAEFVADGVPCRGISTVLEPAGRNVGNPVRLQGNADIAFIGCYPLGSGFVIDSSLMKSIEADPRNSEVIALYLTGDDLNGSPSISTDKWIIDFNDRSEEAASEYELPFRHVERFVKPERSRNADKSRRTYWWRFTRTAPGLRAAIAQMIT